MIGKFIKKIKGEDDEEEKKTPEELAADEDEKSSKKYKKAGGTFADALKSSQSPSFKATDATQYANMLKSRRGK